MCIGSPLGREACQAGVIDAWVASWTLSDHVTRYLGNSLIRITSHNALASHASPVGHWMGTSPPEHVHPRVRHCDAPARQPDVRILRA